MHFTKFTICLNKMQLYIETIHPILSQLDEVFYKLTKAPRAPANLLLSDRLFRNIIFQITVFSSNLEGYSRSNYGWDE